MHSKLLQSCPTLCEPMNCEAHQVPLSRALSREECWSGFPCPPPRDLPDPGIKLKSLRLPALAGGAFTS